MLLERLTEDAPVVVDGAMGSEIEAAGVDVDNPLWGSAALLTPEGRALNERLHRAYRDAGAELLIANTHNLSLRHCAAYLEARGDPTPADTFLRRLHRAAIESARSAGTWIAGCLASPDVPYAEEASLTAAEVTERLRVQFEALVELAPDIVLFEMLTTKADVEGVAALLDDRVPVGVGLVCRADGAMRSGLAIEDAVAILGERVSVFFVQCIPVDEVDAPLERLLAATDAPVGVYANDGRRWVDGRWHGASASCEHYADRAVRWVEAGAKLVGGCCGTGPQHVAAIAERLSRR
ncbi:MAG: homocysteine S-methyltransferase family protein [Deltaproteobacteria bacterium]